MLQNVPISAIFPREGGPLRKLNSQHVKLLAESIHEIGLQCPISVHAIPCPPDAPYNHHGCYYQVATGNHRLEACKQLGWKEVPAFVLDMNDVDRDLWEIDENLIRAELTELERAEHIKQRKVLYLLKHPETKHGGDHGNQHTGGKKRERQVANIGDLATPVCFVKDTAVKTGMSERDVQRAVHRAEAIDEPVKEAIRDMPEIADKGVELDALAAVEPEEQKAAVEAVRSGKARNVREATKGAKTRKPKRRTRPTPSDEDLVRREIMAALKHCQKKLTRPIAAVQINCDGSAVEVVVTFRA